MTTPIDTLLTVCRNATQGEWESCVGGWIHCDGQSIIELYNKTQDGAFITTFQPKNVERMLELLEELRYQAFMGVENEAQMKTVKDCDSFLSSLSKGGATQ